MKLPELNVPKPRLWDLVALAVVIVGLILLGANLALARSEGSGSISGALTTLFALCQVAVSLGSLMILGKTATEGTIWGNLLATAGCFAGIGGVMLAAALWAAA